MQTTGYVGPLGDDAAVLAYQVTILATPVQANGIPENAMARVSRVEEQQPGIPGTAQLPRC